MYLIISGQLTVIILKEYVKSFMTKFLVLYSGYDFLLHLYIYFSSSLLVDQTINCYNKQLLQKFSKIPTMI